MLLNDSGIVYVPCGLSIVHTFPFQQNNFLLIISSKYSIYQAKLLLLYIDYYVLLSVV